MFARVFCSPFLETVEIRCLIWNALQVNKAALCLSTKWSKKVCRFRTTFFNTFFLTQTFFWFLMGHKLEEVTKTEFMENFPSGKKPMVNFSNFGCATGLQFSADLHTKLKTIVYIIVKMQIYSTPKQCLLSYSGTNYGAQTKWFFRLANKTECYFYTVLLCCLSF